MKRFLLLLVPFHLGITALCNSITYQILDVENRARSSEWKTLTVKVANQSNEACTILLAQGQLFYDSTNYNTQSYLISCIDEALLKKNKIDYSIDNEHAKDKTKQWRFGLPALSSMTLKIECYCYEPSFDLLKKGTVQLKKGNLISNHKLINTDNCTKSNPEVHQQILEAYEDLNLNCTGVSTSQFFVIAPKDALVEALDNAIKGALQRALGKGRPVNFKYKALSNGGDQNTPSDYIDDQGKLRQTNIPICVGQGTKDCNDPDLTLVIQYPLEAQNQTSTGKCEIKFSCKIKYNKERWKKINQRKE